MENDPWTVPIHVLSRNPELVERFKRFGYVDGLELPVHPKHTPFLRDFMDQLTLSVSDATPREAVVEY